jgi:hypothetical protein
MPSKSYRNAQVYKGTKNQVTTREVHDAYAKSVARNSNTTLSSPSHSK